MVEKRIKLISCNFGGHRKIILENPKEISKLGVDVVNYDDSDLFDRRNAMHPRLRGKIPKMLEWEKGGDYDYYIWVDSKFTILEEGITTLLKYVEGYDLCLFPHPDRKSIREELNYMVTLMNLKNSYLIERYSGEDMESQVKYYLNKGLNDDKLFSCGIFVYSKKLVENKDYNLMKDWFYHSALFSVQDQLSLPYLLQKHNTNYNVYDFDIIRNQYFKYQ